LRLPFPESGIGPNLKRAGTAPAWSGGMMAQIGARRAAVLGAGIVGLAITGTARAQPLPSEAAEINRCLCMEQQISQLSADMSAKMTALHRTDQRLADLTAELREERVGLHVNDPAAVEHYKVLLEEHDATWKNAVGPVWAAANDAVARYNATVREYNGSCAHRLFDSVLMRQVQATLTCQAPGYPPPPAYTPTPPAPSESEYPPAPPGPGYPPAPSYAAPPAPSESEYPPPPGPSEESGYPPAPGYPSAPSPPASGYPPPPPYPGPK
jgi:hypothetical protein